jgi:hypothetical protein
LATTRISGITLRLILGGGLHIAGPAILGLRTAIAICGDRAGGGGNQ